MHSVVRHVTAVGGGVLSMWHISAVMLNVISASVKCSDSCLAIVVTHLRIVRSLEAFNFVVNITANAEHGGSIDYGLCEVPKNAVMNDVCSRYEKRQKRHGYAAGEHHAGGCNHNIVFPVFHLFTE